ncbi:hypothetical protein GWI33_004648 [Rhynchophorus ferrugineus]|uniref:Large ribosomal subunit protein bL34m n=1 Tax=Rhynchophorus ferrugineus TaxID=354439 RepID=A0A834IUG4_RHYFE|nr:hypothetical protein GWI33_004648 [Rhynchophorus ferrugineus]
MIPFLFLGIRMSLLGRTFSSAINTVLSVSSKCHNFVITPGGMYNVITRGVIRDHFPRPSEKKRVKRHGWRQRMSTAAGRRVLMNRILKGRFIYSH